MDKIENQAYLTNFILDSSSELVEISQDNPALFNALVDAFGIMSKEFGTGETEIQKVEQPKVVTETQTPEKKKRGRKKKITISDLNKMSDDEVAAAVAEIPAETLQWIEDLTLAGTPVTTESSPEKRAIPKWIDVSKPPTQVVYDVIEANTTNVISENQSIKYDVWALSIFIGYNFFVDDNGNKIELNTPMIAPATQPIPKSTAPQPSTPQSTSGYQSFNIPNGTGGTYLVEIPKKFNATISLRQDELLSVGNYIFDAENSMVFRISNVEKDLFDAEYIDSHFDLRETSFDKDEFTQAVKNGRYLLVRDSGITRMGLRIFDSFEIEIQNAAPTKPQKQADPAEIAALELELENAELFAELGDEDAKKEVSKLKKKIAKLKA